MFKIENIIVGSGWKTRFVWLDNGDTCRVYVFPFKPDVDVGDFCEFPHIDLDRKGLKYKLIYNNKNYASMDKMIDDFCNDYQLKPDSIKMFAMHILNNMSLYFGI